MAAHVERMCDTSEGLDAAVAIREEILASRGLKLDSNEIALDEILRLGPTDEARRRLAARQQRSNTAPSSAPSPAGASSHTLDGSAGAVDVSTDAGSVGPPPPLLSREWRWILAHALELPATPDDRWGALFSSTSDGRSLHTLAERTSGYTHGTRLVVRDANGFVFGGWAGGGINPFPPSSSAPVKDVDFTGSDKSVLVRLQPSLLVCRTRRKLAEASMKHGGSTHPSGGALKAAAAAAAAGAATVVPADQRFLYFNNRRVGKRGVGFGGSLKSFRLFVDASLERGSSLESCETFADGVLASAKEFDIARIEIWGCGGRDARIAQEEWKEDQASMRRRSIRRSIIGEDDDDDAPSSPGVLNGGKEDRWLLGLLGMFSSSGPAGRDERQDAAYHGAS